MSREYPTMDEFFGIGAARADAEAQSDAPQPLRRPSTKTLRRVLAWLAEQDLGVYGPYVDLTNGVLRPGNMDYDLEQILKLAALRKKYPNGLPVDEED